MSLILDDDFPLFLTLIAQAAYEKMTGRAQVEPQLAGEIAMEIAEKARENLGGGAHVYIPKGRDWLLPRRDREIWDKFKGDNYQALAKEYNLTEMRIRQIVERCRAADQKRRQAGLFGEG